MGNYLLEAPASLDVLKRYVDCHAVIQHPFLEQFRSGTLSHEQLKKWLHHQYLFSQTLAPCFALIYAELPLRVVRECHDLVDLVSVEAWGSQKAETHSAYFLELAEHLDYADVATNYFPRSPAIGYCLARKSKMDNPEIGLACLALANEYLNTYIFAAYREGAANNPHLRNGPMEYFDAHLADEEEDFKILDALYGIVRDHNDKPFFTPSSKAHTKGELLGEIIDLLRSRFNFFTELAHDLRL